MKMRILVGALIGTAMIVCFMAGIYVEQRCSERRMAFVQEAIEDGDRVIFCEDGGIIRVHHNK